MLVRPNEEDLTPEIVSMGTTRVLRVKRIGKTYFVENMQQRRDDANAITDEWKIVAVAKPEFAREKKTARQEAHDFLAKANIDVRRMMEEDIAARGS